MLFTSTPFIFFLFVLLILYHISPQKHRWYALLAGSLVFYVYAGLSYLIYISATIITVYAAAMRMRRLRIQRDTFISKNTDKEARKLCRAESKALCRKWLLACLSVNFGILAVIKYTDFAIGNVNILLSFWNTGTRLGFMRFAAPLGISFYTFQSMAYLLDVYREKAEPETHPLKFALFVSFFPQVIQGPISRFNELSKTLYAGTPLAARSLNRGGQRILWGFFKKLVIADRLWPAIVVLQTQADAYQGLYVLLQVFLYAVALFCDFTGGIDITIGAAEMFGIKITENFNRPFYSKSIVEYWRRWHITMGSWFRDYVFYPLSVCKPMLKLSKAARSKLGEALGRRIPVYTATLSVWFLTGLWHGASWNFIAWGLANGTVILVSQEFHPLYNRFHKRFAGAEASKLYGGFQIFRTFWLMCFIRSFDNYAGVGKTFNMMLSVVTRFNIKEFLERGVGLGLPASGYISAGLGLAAVLFVSFLGRKGTDARDRLAAAGRPVRYTAVGLIFFMILVFGAYGMGYDARQFIYNQF